jgi:hypothetical protein
MNQQGGSTRFRELTDRDPEFEAAEVAASQLVLNTVPTCREVIDYDPVSPAISIRWSQLSKPRRPRTSFSAQMDRRDTERPVA